MEVQVQPLAIPPLLTVAIETNGRVHVDCHVPKLEAVKMLLNVIEELRLQGYEEQRQLVKVARISAQ